MEEVRASTNTRGLSKAKFILDSRAENFDRRNETFEGLCRQNMAVLVPGKGGGGRGMWGAVSGAEIRYAPTSRKGLYARKADLQVQRSVPELPLGPMLGTFAPCTRTSYDSALTEKGGGGSGATMCSAGGGVGRVGSAGRISLGATALLCVVRSSVLTYAFATRCPVRAYAFSGLILPRLCHARPAVLTSATALRCRSTGFAVLTSATALRYWSSGTAGPWQY
eukprot:446505-Rhodomonas_salina.1